MAGLNVDIKSKCMFVFLVYNQIVNMRLLFDVDAIWKHRSFE